MKIVAKCLFIQPLSSEVKDNLCNPISLNYYFLTPLLQTYFQLINFVEKLKVSNE